MDNAIPYNETQKGELSESCLDITADHILNATESSVGREERKANWESTLPIIIIIKKNLNFSPKDTMFLDVLFWCKLQEAWALYLQLPVLPDSELFISPKYEFFQTL